jgi:hypothetical protein
MLFQQHRIYRTRPSLDEISKALYSVTTYYSRAFIIVDALDECRVRNGCRQRFLSEIFRLQNQSGANIFATSRFIPDVQKYFEGSIILEIRASSSDVQRYLDGEMSLLPEFVSENLALQEEIKSEIIKAVDGMYVTPTIEIDKPS